MRKYIVLFQILFLHALAMGQTLSVSLSQGDTTICKNSTVRINSTVSFGSLKYIGTNGTSDYFMDTIPRSWTAARTYAQSMGMDLWIVDDASENNNVYNLIPYKNRTDAFFWIGLNQDPTKDVLGADSGWHWIDGRALDTTYKNWYTLEPDNVFGIGAGANYASIGLNFTTNMWSDMTDVYTAQYSGYAILEKPHATISYAWSNGATSSFQDITPLVTTGYSLNVTYGALSKSSGISTITVNNPKATSSFSLSAASEYCFKKNLILFNNTTITTDPLTTYVWDFGDGTTANVANISHQFGGAQAYNVSLTAKDLNGCKTIANSTITIKASPNTPIITYPTGKNVFCDLDSVLLKTVVPQLDPLVTYNWFRGITSVGTGSSYNAKIGGNYYLVASNANGCKDTSTLVVTVNPLPAKPTLAVVTGYLSSFCQTDSSRLDATTASLVTSYTWYTGSAATPTTISGPITKTYFAKAPAGMSNTIATVNYLVRVTDSKNCMSLFSDPLTISTRPSPTALITSSGAPTVFCEGDSVQFFLAAPVATNLHEWLKDNTVIATGVTNIAAKLTGVYRIKETNTFSCSVLSNAFNVVVNKYPVIPTVNPDLPVPEITSTGQVNICTGSNATLRTPSLSGASYQWYYNGAIMTGFTGVSATVNKAGNYKVIVKVSGCSTTSLDKPLGLLPLPTGVLNQPSLNTVCDGFESPLSAYNAFGYQWYYNNVIIPGANSDIYNAKLAGVYKVEFSTNKGCKAMSTTTVTLALIKKPVVAFTYDMYCLNTASNFNNQSTTSSSGTVDYLWRFQNGTTDNSINPIHTFTTAGLYKVTLVITPFACPMLADSLSTNIQVATPTPGIAYTPINAILGKPLSLVARSFGDLYEWKPTTGFNSPYLRIPILNPTTEQVYTVQITDRAGCVTVDSQLVRIFDEQDVFVAGGFTPNFDGKNDRVYPMLVGIASFNYLKIFNRWGNLVFETNSTDPAKGWDGRYRGKDQPADTYTWILEARGINGRLIRKSGSTILIR